MSEPASAASPRSVRIRYGVAALIGFVASAGLFVWVAHVHNFDGLYGQDPYAYYDFGGQLNRLFTTGHGLGYFFWPLGYPTLIGLSFLVTGVGTVGAQAISIGSGALVCALTGLLTLEIGRTLGLRERAAIGAAVIAWAMLTVCGQLMQSSIVIMSDAPALMWAVLSAWALTIYARTRYTPWIALTAFALGGAAMTRWQYAALAVPWALCCLTIWGRAPQWRVALLGVGVGVITLAPQIAYSAHNPDPVLHHMYLEGWSPANAFARDFVTAEGTFHYDQVIAAYYLLPITSPYYLNLLFLPLIGIGFLRLFTPPRSVPAIVLLIGWMAVEYGFLAGIPYQNIRFALSFLPPLIVLAAIGAVVLCEKLVALQFGYTSPPVSLSVLTAGGSRTGMRASPSRAAIGWRVLITATLAIICAYGLIESGKTANGLIDGFVANKDRDLAAVRWAESLIPDANATVYNLDLVLTMGHYSTLKPVQIYYETTDSLAARLPNERPAYALFNVWTTEHQWVGKTPWLIYHWLLDHPGLTPIGSYSIYTLYRVEEPHVPTPSP